MSWPAVRDNTSPFERFLLGAPEGAVDKFFSSWSPDLIMHLRSVNSNVFMGIEAYVSRAWSIERSFDRWFFHAGSFLRMLEACDAVVSGSEAQQHLARHEFRGKDLDIYVPYHGLLRMGRWLKQQGFLYQASGGKHLLFDAAAIMLASAAGRDFTGYPGARFKSTVAFSTFNFVWPQTPSLKILAMDGAQVQLIAVCGDPIRFLIDNFHSTGVMNYITGTHAVSLFPRSTFVDRQMYVCQDTARDASVHQAWMAKYRDRGFTIVEAEDEVPNTPEVREWCRKIGDSRTWVLPHERSVPSKRQKPTLSSTRFEVLPTYSGVTAAGACLRVGPRFLFSSAALVASGVDFGQCRSNETAVVFGNYSLTWVSDDEEDTGYQ